MVTIGGEKIEGEPLSISQVAKRSGISIQTVRFYEREGLIEPPPRSGSGYRLYPEKETMTRLQFIRRAKEFGFSLKEIKELLSLSVSPSTTCKDIKNRAKAKLTDLEDKVRTLQRMKKALAEVTAACSGKGSISTSSILEAMERRGKNSK